MAYKNALLNIPTINIFPISDLPTLAQRLVLLHSNPQQLIQSNKMMLDLWQDSTVQAECLMSLCSNRKEAMIRAVECTKVSVLEHLMNDADVDDVRGALYVAAKIDAVECAKVLLRFQDPRIFNDEDPEYSESSLYSFERNVEIKVRDEYRWDGFQGRFLPIHMAAGEGSSGVLSLLIEQPDIDLLAKANDECNALHYACKKGMTKCLKVLLDLERFDVNDQESHYEGWTPLHLAVKFSSVPCVQLLLRVQGINVNARGFYHDTPLDTAIDRFQRYIYGLEGDDTKLRKTHGSDRWIIEALIGAGGTHRFG